MGCHIKVVIRVVSLHERKSSFPGKGLGNVTIDSIIVILVLLPFRPSFKHGLGVIFSGPTARPLGLLLFYPATDVPTEKSNHNPFPIHGAKFKKSTPYCCNRI